MGGRMGHLDSYLGSGEGRTSDYSTLETRDEGFEFVIRNANSSTKAPIYSNKADNIYATVNSKGAIDSITVYKDHKEIYTIHPGKHGEHGGLHVHSPRGVDRTLIPTSNEHRTLYNKVMKSYKEKSIAKKALDFRSKHEK